MTTRTVFPAGLEQFISTTPSLQLILLDAAEGWTPSVASVTIADLASYEATFAWYSRREVDYTMTATPSTVTLTAPDIVIPDLGVVGDVVGTIVVACGSSTSGYDDPVNNILCALSGVDVPLTGNDARVHFPASGFLTFTA